MKRLMVFILLTLLCFAPISYGISASKTNHTIAGYGPVYGELFSPKSMQIYENKIFVIDEFGVSSFDLATQQFIKRFPVDLGREDLNTKIESTESMAESQTWIDWLKEPFARSFLRKIVPLGSGDVSFRDFSFRSRKIDLSIDSKGLIYLLGMKGINVYNPENGQLIHTMPVPILIPIQDPDIEANYLSMKIFQDKLYILQNYFKYPLENCKASIQVFSLQGQLEKVIPINYNKKTTTVIFSDFTFLPDLKLFVFWNSLYFRLPIEERNNPLYLCDETGVEVKTDWKSEELPLGGLVEYQEPNRLVFGSSKSGILSIEYLKNSNGRVEFEHTNTVFPYKNCIDLICSTEAVYLISGYDGPFYSQVLQIKGEGKIQYGSSPNHPGQVFTSTAFAPDKKGNLFLAQVSIPPIQQFDISGLSMSNSMDIPKRIYYETCFRDFTFDDQENLYGISLDLLENCIYRYSSKQKNWEKLFSIDSLTFNEDEKTNYNIWYNIEVSDEKLFVLDSGKLFGSAPGLQVMTAKKDSETEYRCSDLKLTNSPKIKLANPPFFIGFKLTDNEYQFLDCQHQEIWIYDRETEAFKEKIQLPKSKNSFYSSIDLYPDGTFLVTDAIQNKFLHLSKKGEVLETFGESGAVAIGTTKEAYLEKPNQFNGLFRAKIKNGYIYANDLFNYRFHIFPIPQRPTLEWTEKDTNVEKISIFENKEVAFYFSEPTHQNVPFQVSSTTPWIQILNPGGMTGDGFIKVSILGDKLLPWDFNAGKIQVTFPDYPDLNTELRILIEFASGNILTLTIGSSQASLNGQAITLDSASIPLLKQGRTFVGIRLMGEMVFSNTAKIAFDAKTQTVYFEIGQKKIELVINQSFALVNGTKVPLDAPPFIQAGRTFVPLRFISENLDATVDYDSKAQSITITYPKKIHT